MAHSVERVLVGWDGSDCSKDAVELARILERAVGVTATAATVAVPRMDPAPAGPAEMEWKRLEADTVGSGLKRAATTAEGSLIVLGSSSIGVDGHSAIGTNAEALVEQGYTIAVAPRDYARRYAPRVWHVVAVGFGSSPDSDRALHLATMLVSATGGQLRILHFGDAPARGDELDAETLAGVDLLVLGETAWEKVGRPFVQDAGIHPGAGARCPVVVVPAAPVVATDRHVRASAFRRDRWMQ